MIISYLVTGMIIISCSAISGKELATINVNSPVQDLQDLNLQNTSIESMAAQSTEPIGHYYINESRKLEGEHQQYYELKGALRILNHKTDDATANHIIRKLASSKETHPSIKAEANLRNAYLKLRENDYNAAESIFRDLAEGIIPCGKKTALDAAYRFAAIRHNQKDRVGALDTYIKCAELQPDNQLSNEALVQAAGLCLELGKGWLENGKYERFNDAFLTQCQDICKQVVESPASSAQARILAELMYIEVFHFRNQPYLVLDAIDHFIAAWESEISQNPEFSKQVATAWVWKLISQFNVGEYEAAVGTADGILVKFTSENSYYDALNAPGYALAYKIESLRRLGVDGSAALSTLEDQYTAWYNSVGKTLIESLKMEVHTHDS